MFRYRLVIHSAAMTTLLLLTSFFSPTICQTNEGLAELKAQAEALVKQTRLTEALPLLEKIVAAEPQNARMVFNLGFALIAKSMTLEDGPDRRALRVRARDAFIKAKELKINEPVVEALIQSLPPDGSPGAAFSENVEANALMVRAEGSFSQGNLDAALADYQKALQLDPKLYHAALFCGDVSMQKGDYNQAEIWYQKAITIDPLKETAYRYSATPLMKQGKTDAARDRYVEAFIVEPYSRFARAGLIQWSQITGTNIGHPKIDIPSKVTFDEKGDAKIDLDASVLLGGKDDGSFAWISYGATRSAWHKEKFAQTFPNEKSYRHSLPEEADALRSVIALATSEKKVKKLSPSLAKLKKLNDEGLLEAYILLGRADEGISQDYPAYLKQNRDKLRRYVVEFVLTAGGD